jgi:hypothetical protein
MRVLAALLLLFVPAVVLGEEPAEDPEPVHELRVRWQEDRVYTTTEREVTDTTTTFEWRNAEGERLILRGLISDVHERTHTRRVTAVDEEGASAFDVHCTRHRQTRRIQTPDDNASRLEFERNGALHGVRWDETWRDDAWVRRPTVLPRDDREVRDRLRAQHPHRHHFMLPPGPVAVGADWEPDLSHVLARLSDAGLAPGDAEIKAVCKLVQVEAGVAVIELEWSLDGLKPVRGELRTDWDEDVEVRAEGTARLEINTVEQRLVSERSRVTLRLSGKLWKDNAWLPATSTLVTTLTANTRVE